MVLGQKTQTVLVFHFVINPKITDLIKPPIKIIFKPISTVDHEFGNIIISPHHSNFFWSHVLYYS